MAFESGVNGSQKRRYRHHHNLPFRQQSELAVIDHDEAGTSYQLRRTLSIILEAVGFEAADPDALESFALHVEEFMRNFLAYAKASMFSGRRNQAIPYDFDFALNCNRFTLRCLLPHLDTPVDPTRSSLPLILDSASADQDEQLMTRFHTFMNDNTQARLPYAPRILPVLPSSHTFKASISFMPRERDPKRIRELATEEARMGEEALRRLVLERGRPQGIELEKTKNNTRSKQQQRRKMWQETMQAIAAEKLGDTEMLEDTTFKVDMTGVPVNGDRVNWRKLLRRSEQHVA